MMITIWMETLVLSMTVILIYHKMSLNINNINNKNKKKKNNNNRNKPSMERGAMILLLFTMRMFVCLVF